MVTKPLLGSVLLPGSPAVPASAESAAAIWPSTRTMKTSARATESKGKGASVNWTVRVPMPGPAGEEVHPARSRAPTREGNQQGTPMRLSITPHSRTVRDMQGVQVQARLRDPAVTAAIVKDLFPKE